MSRWWIRASVSVAIAVVLLTFVPLGDVWSALRRIRPWVWAGALGVFAGGHFLNALKLRLFIGSRSVSVAACVQAQFAGLAANLGLPGVAGGDFVRAAYLVPTGGLSRVAVASVADRILDTLVLAAIIAVAVPLAGVPPVIADLIRRGGWWLAAVVVAGTLLAAIAWRVLGRLGVLPQLRQAWTDLRGRPAAVVGALAISVFVQSTFVLANVWLAREVGVTTAVAAWFVAWPASKLTAVLPISLGGIGVREAALVFLLSPYGAPADGVVAAGILWEGVLVVGGVAGLIFTQVWRRRSTAGTAVGSPGASA